MTRLAFSRHAASASKRRPTNPFARASDERLMQLFGVTEADFGKIRTNVRREIWAYGVRNPYPFSFGR